MQSDGTAPPVPTDDRFAEVWQADRSHLLALAARMLGDPAEAQDVVQEAFSRLALVEIDGLADPRGWLTVVTRRLCLDRIRSARSRRESPAGAAPPGPEVPGRRRDQADPADRVTLDDQVQQALAVVLDRLTPAERTVFVLHDVFGFPFDAIAEIVGRTPAACRQLASRARRSIRADAEAGTAVAPARNSTAKQRAVAERFIAACRGGDLGRLMELLDPDVVGEASVLGRGPLLRIEGRPNVARRILGLFGPGNDFVLTPLAIEDRPAVIAMSDQRIVAVVRFDETDGLIHHIHSFLPSPAGR